MFAGRFSAPRDCLIAYLALESAEVLSGVKPGNLLNLPNKDRGCGQNLYHLWHEYGESVLSASGLEARELVDRGHFLLLYVYKPQSLSALLSRRHVIAVLAKAGYPDPSAPEAVLDELQVRLLSPSFPHEIGVILGYPLKDVTGFMGWSHLPFSCQGPWKIYGDPAVSLKLANACQKCRKAMARKLARCREPGSCLTKKVAGKRKTSVIVGGSVGHQDS